MSRLRIATFNLESLDDGPHSAQSLADRIAILRPMLLSLDADILCLQEVNAQVTEAHRPRGLTALCRLLAETPYAGFAVASGVADGERLPDHHNLVVLSRFPIAAHRAIRHELVPQPVYRPVTSLPPAEGPLTLAWDRPILLAAIALPAAPLLHVLNLHLKAPIAAPVPGQKISAEHWRSSRGWAEGLHMAAMKRHGQALEARLLIEQLFDRDSQALVLVAGDFNADRNEAPIRVILGECDDAVIEGLPERALVALDDSLPAERRYSVLHAGRRAMFEHLLASRGLAALPHRVEVHNEGLRDEQLDWAAHEMPPQSHHAPLVVEFRMDELTY